MKIQFLSNKRRVLLWVSSIVFLCVVVAGGQFVSRSRSVFSYHVSQWNELAPEVDRASARQDSLTPIGLEHVYGGIVSHHIPTTLPQLVEFYSRLKKNQRMQNIIVIGPDHTDAGKTPISVSAGSFFTVYGEIRPIDGLAHALQDAELAAIDEPPFEPEHSIGSQMLVIGKVLPGIRVTPIIVRSDTSRSQAKALGRKLAEYINDDTVLVASVDFSHYLPTDQAMPVDQVSGDVLKNLDLDSVPLVQADSSKSMVVFMSAMLQKNARDTDSFTVLNTNHLMQNSDYTTGYVFGYWGIKKGEGR